MTVSRGFSKNHLGSSKSDFLFILAILSGACGLAYQVVYVRLFSSYFGDSFIISGVMLFSVFIGIAFGAWQSGRFVRRLAYIELGIGFYSIFVATLFSFWGFDIVSWGNHLVLNVCKLIVFLLIPTFLIGTCVPLFAQYVGAVKKTENHVFTNVYALYNGGAFLSVLAVEFILFRQIGLQLTFYVVGAINFIIGLSLLLSRVSVDIHQVQRKKLDRRVGITLFLASFASGVFQLYALRLSFIIFAPLPENFSIILTSAILGIALGSAFAMTKVFSLKLAVIGSSLGSLVFLLLLSPLIYLWSMTNSLGLSDTGALALRGLFLGGYPLILFTLFGTLVPLAVQAHKDHHLGVADSLLALSSLANGLGALMFLVLYQYLTLLQMGFFIFAVLALSCLVLFGKTYVNQSQKLRPLLLGIVLVTIVGFFITHFWPRVELLLGYRIIGNSYALKNQKETFRDVITYKVFDQEASIVSFEDGSRRLMSNGYIYMAFRRLQ